MSNFPFSEPKSTHAKSEVFEVHTNLNKKRTWKRPVKSNCTRANKKTTVRYQKPTNLILGREVANKETPVTSKKLVKKRVIPAKKKATVLDLKKSQTSGLNSVQNKKPVSKRKVIKKEKVKSVQTKEINVKRNLTALEKLGFVSAANVPKEATGIYTLGGEIGKFLQKQQPHKSLILIKGNKHSSKSQLAMQIANAYAEIDELVAYVDEEQGGLESKDTVDSINRNTSEAGRKNISIIGFLENPFEDLQKFCKVCKVIVADSVTDLKISADQLNELRNKYPKVTWVFISQVKENGAMYGGNKMAHNPTVIINCSSDNDPKKRIATLEKNRGNDIDFKYSMYHKKLITEGKNQKKEKSEVQTKTKKLSFKVK